MSQAANTELDLESDLIVRKLEVTLLVDITVLYLEVTLLYNSTTVHTVYCTWKWPYCTTALQYSILYLEAGALTDPVAIEILQKTTC